MRHHLPGWGADASSGDGGRIVAVATAIEIALAAGSAAMVGLAVMLTAGALSRRLDGHLALAAAGRWNADAGQQAAGGRKDHAAD